MTALQNIIKEAKSLKKKFPKRFAKWTDYVKQASAIYATKHKGKSPVGKKKVVKKKVTIKKIAKKRISKKPTEKIILKKVHAAKTTSKNLYNKLDKLDEAQHAHMAKRIGLVNNERLKHYQEIIKKIEFNERSLYYIEKALKDKKNNLMVRNFHKKHATELKKYLKELKIQKAELKKLL
jgi:hypothetical protein